MDVSMLKNKNKFTLANTPRKHKKLEIRERGKKNKTKLTNMNWLLCRELIHKTVASLQLRSPNDTAIGTDCCAHGNVMTVPRTACSEPGLIREAVKALNLRCRETEGIIRTHHVPTLRSPGVA